MLTKYAANSFVIGCKNRKTGLELQRNLADKRNTQRKIKMLNSLGHIQSLGSFKFRPPRRNTQLDKYKLKKFQLCTLLSKTVIYESQAEH